MTRVLVLVGLALAAACGGKRERGNDEHAPANAMKRAPRAYAPDLALPEGAVRRLGGTRFRIADRISAFAVSPDGAYVAVGGSDNRVVVWKTATGEQMFEAGDRSAFDRITAVAFAKDSLVYASGDNPIRVVSTKSWTQTRELEPCKKEWIVSLAASPDGTRVAVACDGIAEVRLAPIDGGEMTKIYDVKRPEKFAWSADGAWLATTSIATGDLLVIDVAKAKIARKQTFGSTISRPDSIVFAPAGTVLAYSDEQHYSEEKVRLWDVANDREVGAFDTSLKATAIAFSRDGTTLVYAQDSGVHTLAVVNLATKTRREIMRPKESVTGLAFAGTELWLASEQAVRAWDVVDDQELAGPPGHRGAVMSLAYRADGKAIASGSDDGAARIWDLASGTSRELTVVTDEYGVIMIEKTSDWLKWPMSSPVIEVAWSKDGARLYTASGGIGQGVVRRWSASGKLEVAYPLQDLHTHAFALAPDESVTYSIGAVHDGEDTMKIMRLSDGQIARRIPSEFEEALALSPDGRWLAREGESGTELVDAITGAIKTRGLPKPNANALAFSRDSARIAIGGDGGYEVYRLDSNDRGENGEPKAESEGYAFDGRVESIAFTPDGRLVLGSHRGDVVVARPGADDHSEYKEYPAAHRGTVYAIAIAPDGKSFASGGADGQILIWPL